MAAGTLRQDVVFAIRLLRKAPAFTAAAILTIALAVGVNTAVFSVVNAFLFRPLPVREGARLFVLATHRGTSRNLGGVSYPDLEDYRTSARAVFEDIAGYNVGFVGLRGEGASVDPARGGQAKRVLATTVTGNYFSVLGVQPALGRLFRDDEGQRGRTDAIVVVGHTTWQQRFGADPAIVGKTVVVNGRPCTVVGVAPRGFFGAFAFADSELYLPLNWSGGGPLEDRGSRWLHAIARLRPDAHRSQAQAAMDVVAQRLAREHPAENEGVAVTVLPERMARPIEDAARSNAVAAGIMLGLVTLVLLVGAVNVANLLLARGFERRKELAIRAALGAGRARLLRQMTVESLLLAGAGGTAGVLLAAWIGRALASIRLPGDLPVRLDFHLDARVLAYSAAVVLLTAFVAGVLPALRSTRLNLDRVLRQGRHSQTRTSLPISRALVAAQIAAALVLLVATGLFVRSLQLAEDVDLGFQPEHVLNVHMDVEQLGYTEARGRAFFSEVERRVESVPGVVSSAFAVVAPLGYVQLGHAVDAEGAGATPVERVRAGFNIVSPSYFATMGIAIERGRAFVNADAREARAVAVVNRRLADRLWPGVDPIGRRFSLQGSAGPWIEVVGVTPTGKYQFLFEEPLPYFYLAAAQHYTGLRVLHVRTASEPEALASAVERTIRQLEPDLPLYDVQGMTAALGGGFGFLLVRAAAFGAAVFGALGFVLALVGVYGVMAYGAAQRRHEIGVRIAVGAAPPDIRRLLLGDGIIFVTVGAFTGLAAAAAASLAMRSVLFGVPTLDIRAFGVATLAVACAALAGCGIPAWRASRLDPVAVLRLE